jgi:hypothetical protein
MRHFAIFLTAVLFSISFPVLASPLLCPQLPSGAQLRPENQSFDVLPRIVPANQSSVVEIVPLFGHVQFTEDCTYALTYAPMEYAPKQGGWSPGHTMAVVPENGRIRIEAVFEAEQEHTLIIEKTCGDKKSTVGNFRVYSLEPDLYALRPYKGDFHMHSHRSDGVESPAYVAAACRRAGFHFMALTDHRFYAGSMEAAEAFANVPVDLRIFGGEEVHTPDNPVHIVSFAADAGVTELYRDDETAYREEVAALMESLPPTPEAVNRFHYAACVWAVERIRERGGLSMLAHPYWNTRNRHNVEEPLLNHFFETELFDALELISGFGWESLHTMDVNALQVARYLEERAKGRRIAVCGISDTHGIERSDAFGRYYTVCFSPSLERADIGASIQDLRSVAVETPAGHLPRAYGPFRLVKFTQYLLREILPQHDMLCFEEGRLMLQHAAGDGAAADRLAALQGQTAALYERCWAPIAAK